MFFHNLTLNDLRNNPAVPYEEDEVTRIIQDDVNEQIFNDHEELDCSRVP